MLLCALIMALPTLLMGVTFPLAIKALTRGEETLGRTTGRAYAANTAGAILGSLLGGFVLVPALGLRGATLAASGANLLAGALLLVAAGRRVPRGAVALLGAWVLLLPVAMASKADYGLTNFYSANRHLDGVPFNAIQEMDRQTLELLMEREDPEGALRLYRDREGSLLFQVAGKLEGTTQRDLPTTRALALLPLAAHPAPQRMLIIGLGAGATLEAAKGRLREVDVVEIHPGVVEGVRRFGPGGLLEGVRLVLDDARHHLEVDGSKYDIITSEPSYPTDTGVGSLFTEEYYHLALSRLRPGGLYCQWLPYHMMTNDDVTLMLRTFTRAFPHAALWRADESLDLILLGRATPFEVSAEEVTRRVSEDLGREARHAIRLSRTPEQVAAMPELQAGPVNTDDRPLLEFRVVRNLRIGDLSLLERGASP